MPLSDSGFEWDLPLSGNILIGTNKLPDPSCGCAAINNDTKYAMESYIWETDDLCCRYVIYSVEGIIEYIKYADSYSIVSTPGGVQNAFYFFKSSPTSNTYYISTDEKLEPVNNWAETPQYPIDYTPGVESIDGYYYYTGFGGLLGYEDYPGYSGIDGYVGWSGFSGAKGYSGFGNILNYSGYSGYFGYSGFSGTGYSGISGTSGYGWEGFSGYSGVSGYSGYSGNQSGYSGYSGYLNEGSFMGWSGYSAYSGVSGYSGYEGAPAEGNRFCVPTGYASRPSIVSFDCTITATFHDLKDSSNTIHETITTTKEVTLNVMGNWSSRALDCVSNFPIDRFVPTGVSGVTSDNLKNYVPDQLDIKTGEEWMAWTEEFNASGNTSPSTPSYTLMDSQEYADYLLNHPDCRIRLKPC